MQGQFYGDSGSGARSYEAFHVNSAPSPTTWEDDGPLAREIQQLLGDDFDLDALFLEEVWTFGLPIAIENRQHRQVRRRAQKAVHITFYELDNFAKLSFIQTKGCRVDSAPRGQAAAIARCYDADWLQETTGETAAPMREQLPRCCDTSPEKRSSDRCISYPNSHGAACQLLGVAANSSSEQIKAAHRRMVRQWHPDRLNNQLEEERQFANRQMAAINEAYGMLRSSLPLSSV